MLYVASPDFSQLRTNYVKARDANALAQKSYARAQDLYQHHAIAVKDLEQAESAEVQAGGDLASAEAALRVMGITDPDSLLKGPPSFEVPVLAPIGGEVVEQDVSVGQLIQPGNTQCFMISDTSNMWVLVNVYQKDLPYVRNGDPVTIQTDAYPDVFQGRISYVAASLDPNTRTLQARIQTSNPGGKLKKDMYVTASVRAGTIKDAIALPDSAVLRDSENSLLFMPKSRRISSAGARLLSAKAWKERRRSPAASRPAIRLSEMAVCFCSLPTRCSAREVKPVATMAATE